jgi:hypothetical protein
MANICRQKGSAVPKVQARVRPVMSSGRANAHSPAIIPPMETPMR